MRARGVVSLRGGAGRLGDDFALDRPAAAYGYHYPTILACWTTPPVISGARHTGMGRPRAWLMILMPLPREYGITNNTRSCGFSRARLFLFAKRGGDCKLSVT